MTAEWLIPFLAGAAAGVSPFAAPGLKARLPDAPDQTAVLPRARVAATAGALAAAVGALVATTAWWAGALVSTMLTYGLLVVGVAALLGAVHAWKPLSGKAREEPEAPAPPGDFAWLKRVAGDFAYYGAPAWAVALAFAMRALTPGAFVLPFLAAWAGVVLAVWAWAVIAPDHLPARAPSKERPPTKRAERVLAASYGVGAALVLLVFAFPW